MALSFLTRALAAAIGCAACAAASAQGAQNYPNKPIRIVVPYAAGASTSLVTRLVGQKLTEAWGQPVVVDNRGGAGGAIGTEIVAKSPPDGYTLLLGTVGTFGINSAVYSKLSYDPVKDFAPVGMLATVANILAVQPSLPVTSVKELIALAKEKPGKLNYGSSGNGSTSHLSGEMLKSIAGISMTHVPYKGGAPMMADVLGGQLEVMFDQVPAVLPHAKAGRVRALAVTTARRSAAAPDVPTMAEAGVPGYEMTVWYSLMAPAGTPRDIIVKLNTELAKILNQPEFKQQMLAQGAELTSSTPEQLAEIIRADLAKYARIAKEAGATLD
ncbi:MAG: tripartite tricarboxylate transporter substrate binding protein [Proteobacteria bacterium]|nr:tripartite tricarboxylate transporter substrate binding protein [Pseudomonadota bacterium]